LTLPVLPATPSLRRRMACWFYEGVLLFAVALIAALLFSVATNMRSGIASQRPLLTGFLLVVFAVYFCFFWSKGQTLAMKTWRINVVDQYGRRLTQGRALIRFVYCWTWFLAPLALYTSGRTDVRQSGVAAVVWIAAWALLSFMHPQRQFWHDAWAGTRLVDAPQQP
jgi:uncharacterized RDD family membrane protein YckC